MDRRHFIKLSSTSLLGLTFAGRLSASDLRMNTMADRTADGSYSIVILGDTHFDASPDTIYHTGYSDPKPSREAAHRREFSRNAGMWADHSPRILRRAACLVDDDTRMVFQMGDLIQGDTGSAEVHRKMLDDAFSCIHEAMGPLPLLTVVGNHDIRSYDDSVSIPAYRDYMTAQMSAQLGQEVTKTTFSFMIGEDAFIFIDFNQPDDEEIDRLLRQTEGARYTFLVVHGPVMPYDDPKYYNWFFHGRLKGGKTAPADIRMQWRRKFAGRNVIVLCGHTHATELADWYGDGGRITQMTMSSVWARESQAGFVVNAEGASQYGMLRKNAAAAAGQEIPQEQLDLFEEYRPGLKRYIHADSAGCYKLNVSKDSVTVDFYAGDSARKTKTFVLR